MPGCRAAVADEPAGEPPSQWPAEKDEDGEEVETEAAPLPWRENPLFTVAPFILAQEACERLAYNGIATNIITYLKDELQLSSSLAATMTSVWSGVCYLTPLLGAFLADAYWGRFRIILAFSAVYFTGVLCMLVQSAAPTLQPSGGVGAPSGGEALFWTGMFLVALGEGGIKPNTMPFGADQFDDTDPRQAKQLSRYFSVAYACINLGTLVTLLVVVNVETSVSWTAGFAIIAGAFVLATAVFLAGARRYRHWPPGGSPLSRIARVLAAAVAHRRAAVPAEAAGLHEVEGPLSAVPGQCKLPRTASFKCLERAAVRCAPPGRAKPDRWLVTLTEVEEVKCILRLLPVAFTLITYFALYGQTTTCFILQGQGMDTSLGSLELAPATVGAIDPVAVLAGAFLYEGLLVPWFERRGRPIRTLQRIGAGYVTSMLGMAAAAVTEAVRLGVVDRHGLQDADPTADGSPTVPMSVWWQVPQYAFIGISELLAVAGSLELFYSQAPDAMRSFCAALQVVTMGIGSWLAAGVVAAVQAITATDSSPGWIANNVNQGRLDLFFTTLLVLMALDLFLFLWVASRFRYREVARITVAVEAAVPSPGSRSGIAASFTGAARRMSHDLREGMLRHATLGKAATDGVLLSGRASGRARLRRALRAATAAGGSCGAGAALGQSGVPDVEALHSAATV